jgi:hypothetical protein
LSGRIVTGERPLSKASLQQSLRPLVDTVTELGDRGIRFRSLQEAIDTTPAPGSSSRCSPPGQRSNAGVRSR